MGGIADTSRASRKSGERDTEEATISPSHAAIAFDAFIQHNRKLIGQVVNIARGRETSPTIRNIPEDTAHERTVIAEINPRRTARRVAFAFPSYQTMQHCRCCN
jgi:hypothetical protein